MTANSFYENNFPLLARFVAVYREKGQELKGAPMPEKRTMKRARRDKRQGKSSSTQAGEFVREEMHHIRRGKHGARSTKQAIAIGLSKARRAGVRLRPPAKGTTSAKTRRSAMSAYRKGRHGGHASAKRWPWPLRRFWSSSR